MAAVAALPVICSGTEGGPSQTSAAGTPVAQPSGTTMPAPGTPTNSINNSSMAQRMNGNRINGDRDVNGEGRGVYQNGTYYRNGTYGYNMNAGTTSGYANTNTLYWTTNPPDPNQRNTTEVPGNVLPTPITLPSAPSGATPPPVNSAPPPVNSTPPANTPPQ